MTSTASPRDLLIAVNAAPRISRPAVYRLAQELDRWSDSDQPPKDLAAGLGVPRAQIERALAAREGAAGAAAREEEAAARLGARLALRGEPGYPPGLEQLPLPPPVLYVWGDLPAQPQTPAVAVVGSRRADPYGNEVAEVFAHALAAAGVTVVSGFARGVDAAAHRGALAAEGGRTVAVLGCGLGVDYPSGHARLAREIAGQPPEGVRGARGALVTEFPCGMPPRAWHFPVRNRVIAALANGTLVVQATPRSGSLITARHALDLGREVWAVPGRIFDERSLGPHALIRDGALLVQHPRDLLELLLPRTAGSAGSTRSAGSDGPAAALSLPEVLPEPPAGLPGEVLAALAPGAFEVPEDLAGRIGLPLDRLLGALLELELSGWVKRRPGPVYGR